MLEHLCYCTNIHPAESWEETLAALKKHTLTVRDKVLAATRNHETSYPIGLRLSAQAAQELLEGDNSNTGSIQKTSTSIPSTDSLTAPFITLASKKTFTSQTGPQMSVSPTPWTSLASLLS